ncbi:MAG: C40 family peptidase [Bacteroidetes bacterium]|nr:C40 family peptidase [Bacteroidota bacterium]
MTTYGISTLAVIPMRSQPSDKAEMVNQLLFGETYKILAEKGKWLLIVSDSDGYEGWIDHVQNTTISKNQWIQYLKAPKTFLSKPVTAIVREDLPPMFLSFGSCISSEIKNIFPESGFIFPKEDRIELPDSFDADKMTAYASLWLGSSYLWGGKSVLGVDCSGMVQLCAKLSGYQLFRDASQQATQGEIIDFLEEAKPGDLAFFDNEEGTIIHVGILLEKQKIIHASGKVRMDNIDHHGIYNSDIQSYTHKLRFIRRLS